MNKHTDYQEGVFCWADVVAKDANALKHFYTELFGWIAELQDTEGGPAYYIFKYKGKSVCGLVEMPFMMKMLGMPVVWTSYINVDNVDAIAKKASGLGGSTRIPAMDIASAGRLAVLQDIEGCSFAIWQKKERSGAELSNEPNTWCWNELLTSDEKKAENFYGQLFGWSFQELNKTSNHPSHSKLIQHAGISKKIGSLLPITKEMGGHQPCWKVYFQTENMLNTLEHLKALNGKILIEPFTFEMGTLAVVADPQGAIFNLLQKK